MTKLRWDVFIAHAGADRTRAEQLYQLLSDRLRVFLDSKCLLPGDDWDLALASALHDTRIIAALIPERFEPAYYLREEIAVAIALARREPEAHRVVPIYLDDPNRVPYGLRLKHGLDVRALGLPAVADQLNELATLMRGRDLGPAPEPTDDERAQLQREVEAARPV